METSKSHLKIPFKDFNDMVYKWYRQTRPASSMPKAHLISNWYDFYLNGMDFNFLHPINLKNE
jgi:hypothetical protein